MRRGTDKRDEPISGAALRREAREALRNVLDDPSAAAAAKASAARTLLEHFDEGSDPERERRASEMTVDELDAEIDRRRQALRVAEKAAGESDLTSAALTPPSAEIHPTAAADRSSCGLESQASRPSPDRPAAPSKRAADESETLQ